MISLSKIVEQIGAGGQVYDLSKDFSSFRRTIDAADQEIMNRFEQSIKNKLIGKRIIAKASRGYKQYVKSYEFDVSNVSIENYYDNYVVIAYDNTTPKPKEYFLKPTFRVTILGPATGHPSPQKGGPEKPKESPIPDSVRTEKIPPQHQPMAQAPVGNTPSEQPVREVRGSGYIDAYPIDQIIQDIQPWLLSILKKPKASPRDFIKGLGWMSKAGKGKVIALFDLKIPIDDLRVSISKNDMDNLLKKVSKYGSTIDVTYEVSKMELNETKDEWLIRIKKTMTDKSV